MAKANKQSVTSEQAFPVIMNKNGKKKKEQIVWFACRPHHLPSLGFKGTTAISTDVLAVIRKNLKLPKIVRSPTAGLKATLKQEQEKNAELQKELDKAVVLINRDLHNKANKIRD